MNQLNNSLTKPQNNIPQQDLDFIEGYICKFMNKRWRKFNEFIYYIREYHNKVIDPLESGGAIMDFIYNVEENFARILPINCEPKGKLIPSQFASPYQLYIWLGHIKKMLENGLKLMDSNKINSGAMQDLSEFISFVIDSIAMIEYVLSKFDDYTGFVPLLQMRIYLERGEVDSFMNGIKSLMASIPYNLTVGNKRNQRLGLSEGYFHGILHVMLSLVGFNIHSEDTTNKGRIDMSIELENRVYILEFKFSEKKDLSGNALRQIKQKKYYEKFKKGNKEINLLGVSFSDTERNIENYRHEVMSG